MPTYLDLLPDELYIKIFEMVRFETLQEAARAGRRKLLPKHGHRTNQAVVWHWMNGRPWYSLSMATDGRSLYSYSMKIGVTDLARSGIASQPGRPRTPARAGARRPSPRAPRVVGV